VYKSVQKTIKTMDMTETSAAVDSSHYAVSIKKARDRGSLDRASTGRDLIEPDHDLTVIGL
jgi:hypothetical protein